MVRSKFFLFVAVCVLGFSPNAANAQTFEKRISAAKKIEDSKTYKTYFAEVYKSIGPQMAKYMDDCVGIKAVAEPDFTLVANLTSEGNPEDIAVQPSNKVAECFSDRFKSIVLYPHPPTLSGGEKFPVVIEMKIKP